MRHIVLTLFLALLLQSPGLAQPQPVDLWGGLKAGMTKREVKAVRKRSKVYLTDNCRVRMKTVFDGGRLFAVRLTSYWTLRYNACGTQVYQALERKYGRPISSQSREKISLYGLNTVREFHWRDGDRSINLRLFDTGRLAELSYSLAVGGGLNDL
ncbi:MAG: hypothetical protein AAFR88_05390 [Pseudomonadota bacterium]